MDDFHANPYCLDSANNPIRLNDLVYYDGPNNNRDSKPYRVKEISFLYQGNKPPKAMLTMQGKSERISAYLCKAVDRDSAFGKVVDLLTRVGGRVDAEAIHEYLYEIGAEQDPRPAPWDELDEGGN